MGEKGAAPLLKPPSGSKSAEAVGEPVVGTKHEMLHFQVETDR